MKNKIIIVIDHLGSGGTQRQIVEYLKFADREKFSIKIVNLDEGSEILADEIEELGYEIIGIKHYGFFNLSTLIKLVYIFREEKPDIVHTFLFTADCYGRLAANLAGVKIIISSVRNIDLWQKWYHRLTEKILTRWTDKIIANAGAIRTYLISKKKIQSDKVITVYNGMGLKRFENLRNRQEVRREFNIPQEALLVGMVGRFSEQKDYDTFFQAAEEITGSVYFVAVGDGPLFKNQKSKERIIFTGLRSDTLDLINAMDICVLSSHYEGCPNVILEYMACSKPVIASDVGGCAELIVNGKTGFVIPPEKPKELSDKINYLVKDTKLRKKMGQEGRKRIEEFFNSKIMVKNTEKIYSELIQPKIAFVLSQFPETHETFILREFKALREKGIEFEIFSLKPCKDKVIHPEAVKLIKETKYCRVYSSKFIVHSLLHPLKTISSFLYVIKSYFRNPKELIKVIYVWLECFYIAEIIKKKRIKHIHSHWATIPTTAAVILSKLTGISFSFTAHAWDIFMNSNGLVRKIKKAKFVVTCTDYNRRYLSELMKNRVTNKIYLNYHGIDLNKLNYEPRTLNSELLRILAIGRLVEQKGFEYLIKACSILQKEGIDFQCSIVGSGPLEKVLKSQTNALNLQNRVKFLQTQTQVEIKNLFNQSTIFAQPSVIAENNDRDGIPNVILESLAYGVPVIATNVSGIQEAVIHEKTGILVNQRDIDGLADAIEKTWKNKQLRETLALNGRKLAEEKFNINTNITQLINIFETNGILS